MTDKPCPCKGCLIFPICKSRITKFMNRSRSNKVLIRCKCSILSNWIDEHSHSGYEIRYKRIEEVHDIFTKQ